MPIAATPIQYPLVNGFRQSWQSVEIRLAGQVFKGFKSIKYTRKRNRPYVRGTSVDPIAKVRGTNEYEAECEIWLAEFNYLQAMLQNEAQLEGMGSNNGYGDVQFNVYASYTENGLDTITDWIQGCTLDSTEAEGSESPDPLARKFTLNPIKILYNGIDDAQFPLVAPPVT